jgi:hypothetical protein
MKYLILHLICLTRHPSHARFHLSGIGRELFVHTDTPIPGILITLIWLVTWFLLLLP